MCLGNVESDFFIINFAVILVIKLKIKITYLLCIVQNNIKVAKNHFNCVPFIKKCAVHMCSG